MKKWLAKFRISNALDDRKPLPPAVERAVARSEELRRFAETTAGLDQALKNFRREPEYPASLHAAIMHAVRAAEPEPTFGWQNLSPRLLPAMAIAILVSLGIWGGGHFFHPTKMVSPPAESSALATASSALETGDTLVRIVPGATLSPLNEEMLKLNRDLDGTKKFLLASLP
jgi:hypothetical protein